MFAPPALRCVPPAWARNAHVQTIVAFLGPTRVPTLDDTVDGVEERLVPLRDGDRLLAYYRPGSSERVVYLFHGLGGSTSSNYMRRAAAVVIAAGHTLFAVNHRGSGDRDGLTTLPYQTGRSSDIADALAFGRGLFPAARHVAVGFSLSGNTLLKHLALGDDPQPDFALAINPPVDLELTSRHLLSGFTRLYDFKILQSCRRWVPVLTGRDPDARYRVPMTSTLREFDRLYIAPVSGFASREDYYRDASSRPLLSRVTTPTVLLTAKDDPIVEYRHFEDTKLSDSIQLHIEPKGGHMGYLAAKRTPLGSRRWLDYALDHYLGEMFETPPLRAR